MTRARHILEWHNEISEVDPFTAAAIGAGGLVAGAAGLKAKQLRDKARAKHGTVGRALHSGARGLAAKGLRKGAHKSSAQMYKVAKKLEVPLGKKTPKKKNEEYNVKQDWQKTKSMSGQAVKDAGNVAKRTAVGAGKAAGAVARGVGKGAKAVWNKNLADRQRMKLNKIQRKKERVQAKHDLKLHKKQLKADRKLYKYDPLVH